jgi:hypothetical protein
MRILNTYYLQLGVRLKPLRPKKQHIKKKLKNSKWPFVSRSRART